MLCPHARTATTASQHLAQLLLPQRPHRVPNPRYNPSTGQTGMHCYVKAHWLDIEIAAVALCSMTGPKPSEQVSASGVAAVAPRARGG